MQKSHVFVRFFMPEVSSHFTVTPLTCKGKVKQKCETCTPCYYKKTFAIKENCTVIFIRELT